MESMAQTIPVPKTIDTPSFDSVPPASKHAITLYVPGWENILNFIEAKPEFFAQFKGTYPRIFLHADVKKLIKALIDKSGKTGQNCYPFPSADVVEQCIDFITKPNRPGGLDTVPRADISTHAFEFGPLRFFVIFFPADKTPAVHPFWVNAGMTTSSRKAEAALKFLDMCKEIPMDMPPNNANKELQAKLCNKIAGLLERARLPVTRPNFTSASIQSSKDIYLVPTGMAAIYFVHSCLLQWKSVEAKTVMFGFPFHSTPNVLDWFGGGMEWLGLGTEYEILEEFLKKEEAAGRPVTAVWTEFPSNPLLVSSDLHKLRDLADKYNFALIIDDTIGSFCNVDVLPVADVVVTSLTKSFSGYSDVMGGSVALNSSSPLAETLRSYFDKAYHNYVYDEDMNTLLKNSEDYMSRSKTYNDNTNDLVKFLEDASQKANSSIRRVFYPQVSPTFANYQAFMRPKTDDFEPGYGCLFSVEFDNLDSAIAFYENLHVHHGPHLGAHKTLAMAYAKALYHKILDNVERWDVNASQIRVSVGLEPFEELQVVFGYALQEADHVKSKSLSGHDVYVE